MLQRVLRTLAATAVATAGLVVVSAGPATAAPCPGGENPCVYLPGGSYVLGNPVSTGTGLGASSTVLLTHCDSNTGQCDDLTLNLPGFSITSTPTTVLTLNVPGEGVGLSGITPVLYLGLPSATPGTLAAGLTLTVSGTTFVLFDSSLGPVISCGPPMPIPPVTTAVSGSVGFCSFTLTVSL